MIIKHLPVDGNIPKETNTNVLPDIDAMILEKCEELRKLCFDVNRQCVILVDAKGAKDGTTTSFWNMKMSSEDDFKDTHVLNKCYSNLCSMLQQFIHNISFGSLRISNNPSTTPPPQHPDGN
jgi:hypothetical protein